MSAEHMPAKPGTKDESQSSGSRKTSSSVRPPDQQPLKCPRCDSPNTKFCYYNNYSLSQPRHFCKTCRRYWTKGGALRNVPIGGGCRKNKKMKSSSSRLSSDSKDSSGSSDMGVLKFFHGLSPAMDFQLGGLSLPRFQPSLNQFSAFGDIPATNAAPSFGFETPLMGLNFPMMKQGENINGGFGEGVQGMGLNVPTSLASSIESLSCINQDLHWKLQQQRLAALFGGSENENQKESGVGLERPQPIMFQNLEISKPEDNSRKEGASGGGAVATEWYFDNSYAGAAHVNPTPTNSTSNGNESTSSWSGIQAWTDLNQYSALP
ncbi:hypothetical protein NMG60_11007498 [Bertholletia excelsa]